MNDHLAVDLAEKLSSLSLEEKKEQLLSLEQELQGEVFSKLSLEDQLLLFEDLQENFIPLFESMYSNDRIDLYQKLSREDQLHLLPLLKKELKEELLELSSYPEESAGSIMSTDYVSLTENMTVVQALESLRKDQRGSKILIYYLYIVNLKEELLGVVSLRDLILSPAKTLLKDLLHDQVIFADILEDQESVAKKIEKYDLLAIPIVNSRKQLMGIVSYDEAFEVIRTEEKEDLEKFMGIVSTGEETYTSLNIFSHLQKRIIWIVLLAIVGLISSFIVERYRLFLEHHSLLTIFMPLMTATGGNSASQVASVIIKSLSLGELKSLSTLKIFWKEFRIGFFLGSILSLFLFISIYLFFNQFLLAQVISFAILIQVLTSTFLATAIPLGIYALGRDPAVAASPAISTIVDITGLLIYFWITSLFF